MAANSQVGTGSRPEGDGHEGTKKKKKARPLRGKRRSEAEGFLAYRNCGRSRSLTTSDSGKKESEQTRGSFKEGKGGALGEIREFRKKPLEDRTITSHSNLKRAGS